MKQHYSSIKKLSLRFLQSGNSSGYFSFYYVYPINYCQSEIIWNSDNKETEIEKKIDRERTRPKNHSNKLFIMRVTLIIFSLPLIGFFIARSPFELSVFHQFSLQSMIHLPIWYHVQSTIHHSNAIIILRM